MTYEQYLALNLSPLIDFRFREAFRRVAGDNFQEADKDDLKSMLKLIDQNKRSYEQRGSGLILRKPVMDAELYLNVGYVSPTFRANEAKPSFIGLTK